MKNVVFAALLSGVALPASAGPLLDKLVGADAGWTAASETLEGSEVYTGFSMKKGASTATAERLELFRKEGVLYVRMQSAGILDEDGSMVASETLDMDFDESVLESGMSGMGALFGIQEGMTPETCAGVDKPFSMKGTNNAMRFVSGQTAAIKTFFVKYDIVNPADDCVVDANFVVEDVTVSDTNGIDFSVGSTSVKFLWTLFTDRTPKDTSSEYTAQVALNDIMISVGGAEQFSIDRIVSASIVDPASMVDLVESGYYQLSQEVAGSRMGGDAADFSKYSVAKIWNAARMTSARGRLSIEGAVVKGDMMQALNGTKALQAGRTLDYSMLYQKVAEKFTLNTTLASAGLVDAYLNIDLSMDLMDEDSATSASALMASMPMSLAGLEVKLFDQGAGDLIKSETGMDPYEMSGMVVSGNLGPAKGEAVSEWIGGAKSGGAFFRATPSTPVPFVQVFTGFMGDWSTFGDQIRATTQK